MMIKHESSLAIAAAARFLPDMIAAASPRIPIKNNPDKTVKIFVFEGDDSKCYLEEKVKTISSGHGNTIGCSGHGTGRCKVYFQQHGKKICETQFNTCGNDATKIKDGGVITLTQDDDKVSCEFQD